MAGVKITGGPLLRARLDAVSSEGADLIMAQWAEDAARNIRNAAPRRTGALAGSIKPGVKGASTRGRRSLRAGVRAGVFGAYWGIFIDRGTKAHSIEPREGRPSTTGKGNPALKFESRGATIFRRATFRRRMRRRPFITKGAQDALRASPWTDLVIGVWNRGSESRSFRKSKP